MLPNYDFSSFILLSLSFSVGMIWSAFEIVGVLRFHHDVKSWQLLLTAILLYVAAGGVIWAFDPAPSGDTSVARYDRTFLSVFWGAGLLSETGAYSPRPCDY